MRYDCTELLPVCMCARGPDVLEMKRLESQACRAGVTEEMGGTVAGRRGRPFWLSALVGERMVVVEETG